MPDFDSSEDLARLRAAARGAEHDAAGAHGAHPGAVALAPPPSVGRAGTQPPAPLGGEPPGAGSSAEERAPAELPALARMLDLAALAVATLPALLLGAPLLGYLVGAGAWIAQRALASYDRRWIGGAREPRTQLGLNLFEAFGRIWLLAGAIVAAGVIGGRADGLTAAVVIFAAYSLAFAVRVLSGPPKRSTAR
jgi:hypothetical protein